MTIIDRIETIDFLRSAETSPDGRRVAVVSSRVADDADIFILSILDTSDGITLFERRSNGPFSRVSWSPDGRTLATTEIVAGCRQLLLVEEGSGGWTAR